MTCWAGDSRVSSWLQFQVPPAWRLHLEYIGSPVQDRAEHTGAGGFAQKSRNCRADEAGPFSGKPRQEHSVGYWEGYPTQFQWDIRGFTHREGNQNQRF